MIPLSRKLRQLRGWQRMTLAMAAQKATWPADVARSHKNQATFEESGKLPPYVKELISLSHAYGIVPRLLEKWIAEEHEWRTSAGSPSSTGQGLPQLARYLYRPLPEAAHHLFSGGFVVLDLETTGAETHRWTQACEITILDTEGTPLLNSLINPGFHMPVEARMIHGITDEMVASAPTFRDIGPEIARLIDGQTVVIYNSGYDSWILDRLFIENDIDMPDFQPWCLMLAYAEHFKAPGKYGSYAWQKLSDACAQQSLEWDEDAHRTLADTTMTWRLLQCLALQHSKQQCHCCEEWRELDEGQMVGEGEEKQYWLCFQCIK